MFGYFKKPKTGKLSFLDWSNRAFMLFKESTEEIKLSGEEDTVENIIKLFTKKSEDLLRGIEKIKLDIDTKGIYFSKLFSKEKVYVFEFDSNGRVAKKYEGISAIQHISSLAHLTLVNDLEKLNSKRNRLKQEIAQVENLIDTVEFTISRLTGEEDGEKS
jgi:hypothetical protein